MEYIAYTRFSEERHEEKLSETEYEKILFSRKVLMDFMCFQEQVRQLIIRLYDVEKFQLETALSDFLVKDLNYHSFQEGRIQANNLVAAYLNTMLSLKDQATNIEAPKGEFRFRDKFRTEWKSAKEDYITFRLANRFRVYAQHQNQPITGITTGGGWDENRMRCEHHVTINASIKEICRHREITDKERDDYLAHFGATIDVAHLLRCTSSIISKITKSSISEIHNIVEDSISNLRSLCHRFRKSGSEYIDVVAINKDGKRNEFVVFEDFIHRAETLLRFRILENYEDHYVSNRERGHAGTPKTVKSIQ